MAMNNRPPSRSPRQRWDPRPIVTHASIYSRRVGEGTGPGMQYAGKRDVYAAAGYKKDVTYADVQAAWEREHIARRLVDIFPDYTWRKAPVIVDGPDVDGPRDTDFCKAWDRLWESGRMTEDGDTMVGLDWSVPELDRVAMMGKWAVLFLGFTGEELLSEPVTKGQFTALGADALAYTSVYAEPNVTVSQWDQDPRSPRFGKPVLYSLKSKRGGESTDVGSVHWTRVIHLAHNGLADLIEGTPAITHVFNLLQDLLKIIAGTGEAGYRNADPGMIIKTQPAFEAPEAGDALEAYLGDADPADEAYLEELREAIQNYVNGLERFMILEGYEVDMLSGDVPDPRGPVSTLVDLVSGATGIPQRLLLGNEAGELASTQDQANWSAVIETRQIKVAQPLILRPLVNRLIWAGVLPEPREGMDGINPYSWVWPSLYSIDPKVEAEVAQIVANVLKALGVTVDPELFMAQYLPDLDPSAILDASVPVAPDNPLDNMDPSADPNSEQDPNSDQQDGQDQNSDQQDNQGDNQNPFTRNRFTEGPVNGGKYP